MAREIMECFATPSERQVHVTALLCAIETARKKGVGVAQIRKAETKLAAASKFQVAHDIEVQLILHRSICALVPVAHIHAPARISTVSPCSVSVAQQVGEPLHHLVDTRSDHTSLPPSCRLPLPPLLLPIPNRLDDEVVARPSTLYMLLAS